MAMADDERTTHYSMGADGGARGTLDSKRVRVNSRVVHVRVQLCWG
jgi:hypothetical protein